MKCRFLVLLLGAVPLLGCAVNTPYTPPVVDMRGVDPAKYNADLSDCDERVENGGPIQFGPVISNCMEEKGYRIFEKRS